MATEQLTFPFRLLDGKSLRESCDNSDLIGQSFLDGSVTITVIGLCPANPKLVIVERELDGKRWSVPAGVMRLIVGRRRKRRAA